MINDRNSLKVVFIENFANLTALVFITEKHGFKVEVPGERNCNLITFTITFSASNSEFLVQQYIKELTQLIGTVNVVR